jgi:hypothetical protein
MRNKILFSQAKLFRLRILLINACLICVGNYLSAQAAGDYLSIASGLWNNIANWQRHNGTAFVAATDFPGQNPGTGEVTIANSHVLVLNVSPANPIASLLIQGGGTNTSLTIGDGFTLTVTGNAQISPPTGGSGIIKAININGPTGQLNCASLVLVQGGNDNRVTRVTFNDGGVINVTGTILASILQPQRTTISFFGGGGILNVGGNIVGGEIIPGSGTINFTGSGTQTIGDVVPITLFSLGMTNAASTLQLEGNVTLNGTLTLTNGKINTQANTLTLSNGTPANQISGGSNTSYVYSTGAGRFQRNGLAATTAYPFPIGTATNFIPITVTPTTTSNFAMNVFSPASTNGVEGGPAFSDKSKIVDAVWNIDRPVGTGNSTITIQWVDALEGATFATYGNGQIGVSRNVAGSWTTTVADGANTAANTVTATFNTFSPFGVGLLGAVLPVKFGSIKAYEKQNGIQLDWKVYSENKVKSYEVERSTDARSYTTFGSLPALYNNTADGDYGFFDANPLPGISYYRIKNNDLDGRSSYSIIIRVNRNKSIKGLSLYPNPVMNGNVLLQGSDLGRGNYKINIYGANGQEIYKQQIKHNGGTISQTIELPSTISKGVYMLSIKDDNGNIIFNEKLVKQ